MSESGARAVSGMRLRLHRTAVSCSTTRARIELHVWRGLVAHEGSDKGKKDLAKVPAAVVLLLLLVLLLLGREVLLVVRLRLVLVALGVVAGAAGRPSLGAERCSFGW